MFSQTSNFVEGVDTAFAFILGIIIFFLVAITIAMIYFVFKFSRKKNPVARDIKESMGLEITWIIIPTILVMGMFYFGWEGYRKMRDVPDDVIEIKAIGRMWTWSFEYANGKVSPELYVPINQAIKLNLYSPDVVHSLYIPAFRIKEDVVPGIDNHMWFEAQKLGRYDILCAEYCGVNHSYMLSSTVVVSQADYDEWVNTKEVHKTVEEAGLSLLKANGCIACHSTDGSKIVGPSFKDLFGRETVVETENGEKTLKADAEYLKRAIYEPNVEVVKGYNKGMMVSYKELISEEDLSTIIEYLKATSEQK